MIIVANRVVAAAEQFSLAGMLRGIQITMNLGPAATFAGEAEEGLGSFTTVSLLILTARMGPALVAVVEAAHITTTSWAAMALAAVVLTAAAGQAALRTAVMAVSAVGAATAAEAFVRWEEPAAMAVLVAVALMVNPAASSAATAVLALAAMIAAGEAVGPWGAPFSMPAALLSYKTVPFTGMRCYAASGGTQE
jgi:hypothetical protein